MSINCSQSGFRLRWLLSLAIEGKNILSTSQPGIIGMFTSFYDRKRRKQLVEASKDERKVGIIALRQIMSGAAEHFSLITPWNLFPPFSVSDGAPSIHFHYLSLAKFQICPFSLARNFSGSSKAKAIKWRDVKLIGLSRALW
jgi:hypothetical protein